jgi:hypothetical protein
MRHDRKTIVGAFCLLAFLASSAANAQDRAGRRGPPTLDDLRAAYDRALEDIPGYTMNLRFTYMEEGTGVSGEATMRVWVWRQETEEHPRQLFLIEERPQVPLAVRFWLDAQEATYLYPEDGIAYIYDLSVRRNIPWQWVLLHGPGPETSRVFALQLTRPANSALVMDAPEDGSGGGEAPAGSSGAGAQAGELNNPTITTERAYTDPHAEDAWIVSARPRDRALRDEIEGMTLWFHPQGFPIYRIVVQTASENLRVELRGWQPLREFPEDVFRKDLGTAEVRRR